MHEHHLTLNLVPPGHPGASYPVAHDADGDPIRLAMAEAELLRDRIRQLELACPGAPASEAA
jgi:hypothetical protein